MSEVAKSAGADVAELQRLLAALPQDTAGSVLDQLRHKVAANEAEAKRRKIVGDVGKILEVVGEELVAAVPPGRMVSFTVVAAVMDGDKVKEPARLSFDVDMGGGLRSTGGTKGNGSTRKSGTSARMTLDGETLTSDSWRSMLDVVNERLKAKDRAQIAVPKTSFNARQTLLAAVPKVPGLVYVGDVTEAPAPAPAPETK